LTRKLSEASLGRNGNGPAPANATFAILAPTKVIIPECDGGLMTGRMTQKYYPARGSLK
jgi:hypothetical protein